MKFNFDIGKESEPAVEAIVNRAALLGLAKEGRQALWADLAVVHNHGCPLAFYRLADFDSVDFIHDIEGIQRHLNRQTGKLEDYFLPRCAK